MIASRRHPIVTTFRDVARGHDTRALVDGWHLLHEAAAAGLTIETIAISADTPSGADAALIDELSRRATVVTVTRAVMQAVSPVRTPSGVAALVRRCESDRQQLWSPDPALVLIAVDVQDPGNAGAIIRSAEAGGATGVIFAGASADPWSWKSLRAAMGSTFRLPVRQERDALGLLQTLRAAGLRVFAAVPRDGTAMHDANLRDKTALLLGGEGGGLSAALVAGADAAISIPMATKVESLNAAVAAAVLVYEARRQRACLN